MIGPGAQNPNAATLQFPMGLAVDAVNDLYVADQANNRVLEFNEGSSVVDAAFRSRLTQVIESFGSVAALARAGRVSVECLATGTEAAQSAQAVTRAVEHGDYIFMPRNRMRFSSGRGGILRSDQVVDSIAFRAAWVKQRLNTEPRDLILIEVVGDSMAPTVEDSDLILANLAEPRFRQDGIYLLRHESGLTVKRIQRRPDGKLLVRSDNPKCEAMVVANVSVIGRVIWIGGCV